MDPKQVLEQNFDLTKRQLEVALHLLGPDSLKEIAATLGIKKSGIQFHATSIYRKAKVKNRYQFMNRCNELRRGQR